VTRTESVSEPEWTDEDRAEVLALAEYRASLCPNGCGQPLSESTSHADVGPEYDTRRTTCRACAEMLAARRADDDGGKGDSRARVWTIIKTRAGD